MAINVFLAIIDSFSQQPCILALGNSTLTIDWLHSTSCLSVNKPCYKAHLFVARLLAKEVLSSGASLVSQHIKGKNSIVADLLSYAAVGHNGHNLFTSSTSTVRTKLATRPKKKMHATSCLDDTSSWTATEGIEGGVLASMGHDLNSIKTPPKVKKHNGRRKLIHSRNHQHRSDPLAKASTYNGTQQVQLQHSNSVKFFGNNSTYSDDISPESRAQRRPKSGNGSSNNKSSYVKQTPKRPPSRHGNPRPTNWQSEQHFAFDPSTTKPFGSRSGDNGNEPTVSKAPRAGHDAISFRKRTTIREGDPNNIITKGLRNRIKQPPVVDLSIDDNDESDKQGHDYDDESSLTRRRTTTTPANTIFVDDDEQSDNIPELPPSRITQRRHHHTSKKKAASPSGSKVEMLDTDPSVVATKHEQQEQSEVDDNHVKNSDETIESSDEHETGYATQQEEEVLFPSRRGCTASPTVSHSPVAAMKEKQMEHNGVEGNNVENSNERIDCSDEDETGYATQEEWGPFPSRHGYKTPTPVSHSSRPTTETINTDDAVKASPGPNCDMHDEEVMKLKSKTRTTRPPLVIIKSNNDATMQRPSSPMTLPTIPCLTQCAARRQQVRNSIQVIMATRVTIEEAQQLRKRKK